MTIIDGKVLENNIKSELKTEIKQIKKRGTFFFLLWQGEPVDRTYRVYGRRYLSCRIAGIL